jgi:hypothetical protein
LTEECLWEAQAENLSEAEVNEAASGNLLTFMVTALNGAADFGGCCHSGFQINQSCVSKDRLRYTLGLLDHWKALCNPTL